MIRFEVALTTEYAGSIIDGSLSNEILTEAEPWADHEPYIKGIQSMLDAIHGEYKFLALEGGAAAEDARKKLNTLDRYRNHLKRLFSKCESRPNASSSKSDMNLRGSKRGRNDSSDDEEGSDTYPESTPGETKPPQKMFKTPTRER